MALSVGDTAPAFTLVADNLKEVSLSDYSGKNVVLLFFPLAFTGVCTEELCTMRDSMTQMNELNAQVLAVSVDSPFTLDKFKAAEGFNFPLLSDFNRETSSAYDSLYDTFPAFGMKGVSKRSAFVIDESGTIRYTEICSSPGDQPDYEAIKSTLAAL